jgi:hypothetical protein
MEHHKPHSTAAFEGYYSKFHLPSGAHLAVICCKINHVQTKPNMLSFTYVSRDNIPKTYQREVWPDEMNMLPTQNGFSVDIPGLGFVRWHPTHTEYHLEHADFTFRATATSPIPWSRRTNTPESWLVNLPLPLHWHVQSLASECDFTLDIPGQSLPAEDTAGKAMVHDEKNWANSFPSAHMWLQAREGDTGFTCAGGQILGMEAFLLGYRSKDLEIDFRPPFALRLAGWGPFMSYKTDWEHRTFDLSVQSFRTKLVVRASAPKGSFFPLSTPFPEGFRKNYLAQSFRATIKVDIYESGWFSAWKWVRTDVFENASLEFGAGYYPPAGSDERSQ